MASLVVTYIEHAFTPDLPRSTLVRRFPNFHLIFTRVAVTPGQIAQYNLPTHELPLPCILQFSSFATICFGLRFSLEIRSSTQKAHPSSASIRLSDQPASVFFQ
jgi:hypothetical protein